MSQAQERRDAQVRSISYWKAGTGELQESNTEISKESVTGGT
jgi:hypothetical protein